MTGLPEFNYPAFNAAAYRLRSLGYHVLNPAENFGGRADHPAGRAAYMRADLGHVMNADAVAVLPGWESSPGALLEIAVALELGLPIIDAHTRQPIQNLARRLSIRVVT
jgi:hypothetical protein